MLLKRSSPTLQPGPQGFRRSQVLDSVTDGLSRRCEPPVVLAATLGTLRHEQFCGRVVVAGRHALVLNNGHALRSSRSLATRSWGSLMFLMRY
jgi:hypothetical protein